MVGLVMRSIYCDPRSDCLPRSNCLATDIGTSLSELRRISLHRVGGYDRVRPPRNTQGVLPFFYLPSLEEMSASIDDPLVAVFLWPTPQPPSSLSLTSLSLANEIREPHLSQLLAAVPRLRILRWVWFHDPGLEDQFDNPVINLDQLMPALEQVRETLTELTIPAGSGYGDRNGPPPLRVQGSMRALANFDRLTKLFIPLVFFTGFELPAQGRPGDCLPRNLEELTLTDDLLIFYDTDLPQSWEESGYTGTIVTWLADVKSLTPRLRKLCLVSSNYDCELSLEDLEVRNKIQELGRHAGIEFTTKYEHYLGTIGTGSRGI